MLVRLQCLSSCNAVQLSEGRNISICSAVASRTNAACADMQCFTTASECIRARETRLGLGRPEKCDSACSLPGHACRSHMLTCAFSFTHMHASSLAPNRMQEHGNSQFSPMRCTKCTRAHARLCGCTQRYPWGYAQRYGQRYTQRNTHSSAP